MDTTIPRGQVIYVSVKQLSCLYLEYFLRDAFFQFATFFPRYNIFVKLVFRLKIGIAVDAMMEQHPVWDQDGTVGSNPAYGNIERCYSSNGNFSYVDSIAA